MTVAWPTELRLHQDRRTLTVSFEDGAVFTLPAEYLRVESPSAEVQGHSPSDRQLIAGKREVRIQEIVPVGHYAVRLIFDDSHATGIFTWDTFHELGREQDERWTRYLQALAAKNLSREANLARETAGSQRRH
ncbi:MAG TPA: DUF971 domain-containing protein [Xanthobacteraceae bacterium]|nr:DUF971 domain-containing protein [Xanthobacteraceae bacterium]